MSEIELSGLCNREDKVINREITTPLIFRFAFFLVFFMMAAITQPLKAQKKVEARITVNGVCEMCKKRIEDATDIKGVVFSEWNADKQELFLVYKPKLVSIESIHRRIQQVGHDTELGTASDSAYANIHSCCRYRTKENTHKLH